MLCIDVNMYFIAYISIMVPFLACNGDTQLESTPTSFSRIMIFLWLFLFSNINKIIGSLDLKFNVKKNNYENSSIIIWVTNDIVHVHYHNIHHRC